MLSRHSGVPRKLRDLWGKGKTERQFLCKQREHKPKSECFDAGSGKPVGGIEPINISYYIIKLDNKKEQQFALKLLDVQSII